MAFRRCVAPLVAMLVSVALVVPAAAETHAGTNQAEQVVAGMGTIRSYALAQELYAYGKATKDALAVVAAASMLATLESTETRREKTTKDTPGTESQPAAADEGDKKTSAVLPDLAAMLATARELAGKDQTLLAMIDDLSASGSRGPTNENLRPTTERVLGGKTDVYRVEFKGGELAEVGLKGDGDTDLDLFVFDENGNQICRDQVHDDTFFMYCKWTPRWTGYFTIEVRNRGRIRNTYVIAVQ